MPDWKNLVRVRLKPLHMEPTAESDLTDELAQHLEDHYRESLGGGASHEDAYRRAIAELNDTRPLRAEAAQRVISMVGLGELLPGLRSCLDRALRARLECIVIW